MVVALVGWRGEDGTAEGVRMKDVGMGKGLGDVTSRAGRDCECAYYGRDMVPLVAGEEKDYWELE